MSARDVPTSSSRVKALSTATTFEGKAPGAVVRRCEQLGVRCELFGGVVRDGVDALRAVR